MCETKDEGRELRAAMGSISSGLRPTSRRQLEMQIEDRQLQIQGLRIEKDRLDLRIRELGVYNDRDQEVLAAIEKS